ncbi:MAG: M23 family metallopeptidase [Spirochaetaceae bacterium]|jgi:murein DD-endopeptidase MepM/ murein hydrolase activator NlpD|nr:M23 family metallopeptidase [Spirochaetaceae bacterium]
MVKIHDYKRIENSFVKKVKSLVVLCGYTLANCFKALYKILKRRYTIVFVPHSEQKIYNLHVTFALLILVAVVLGGIGVSFFWHTVSYRARMSVYTNKDAQLKNTQASLDQLRDEMATLWREARNFQSALSGVFNTLGLDPLRDPETQATSGDLSSFFDTHETADGHLRETDEIKNLANYLSQVVEPIKEMGTLLDSQTAILSEVPNIWPIKGGIGHISMFFGENKDPFSGQLYVHKGIDLSTYRQGDPILATADGQVVTVDVDPGFGNYIIIRHKHGFYTRYGHLMKFAVRTGQRVQQGEVVGYIGNTGRSTGPHLHYEVHIGSDVVDPYKFLNIRSMAGRVNLNGDGGKS